MSCSIRFHLMFAATNIHYSRFIKLDTVRPIMKLLQENNYFTSSPPNLLVHVFSDGTYTNHSPRFFATYD